MNVSKNIFYRSLVFSLMLVFSVAMVSASPSPNSVTGDNVVNAQERSDGFFINGTGAATGDDAGLRVTVNGKVLDVFVDNSGNWLVSVPSNASYIVEGLNNGSLDTLSGGSVSSRRSFNFSVDTIPPPLSYHNSILPITYGSTFFFSPSNSGAYDYDYTISPAFPSPVYLSPEGGNIRANVPIFNSTLRALEGVNYTITASDAAGNTRSVVVRFTIQEVPNYEVMPEKCRTRTVYTTNDSITVFERNFAHPQIGCTYYRTTQKRVGLLYERTTLDNGSEVLRFVDSDTGTPLFFAGGAPGFVFRNLKPNADYVWYIMYSWTDVVGSRLVSSVFVSNGSSGSALADAPSFQMPTLTYDISELIGSGENVTDDLMVADPNNATLTYSLVQSPYDTNPILHYFSSSWLAIRTWDYMLFDINRTTGQITTKLNFSYFKPESFSGPDPLVVYRDPNKRANRDRYLGINGSGFDYGMFKNYTVRVVATNSRGLVAFADVNIIVNFRPVFENSTYRFDLEENQIGDVTPVWVGNISATDDLKSHERLQYFSLPSTPAEYSEINKFTVVSTATNGEVYYIGSGENYEAGPASYPLRVGVKDPSGLQSSANVRIYLKDANDPPTKTAPIPNLRLTALDRVYMFNIRPFFADEDGDRLNHSVTAVNRTAPNPLVASVEGDYGDTLVFRTIHPGRSRITLTGTDPDGASVSYVFTLRVAPAARSGRANDPLSVFDQFADVMSNFEDYADNSSSS